MKPAAPQFSSGEAQLVSPWRHDSTGRTVARHQSAEGGKETHLFSATGVFIDTVPAAEAEAAAVKSAAEAKTADAKAVAANRVEHTARLAPPADVAPAATEAPPAQVGESKI